MPNNLSMKTVLGVVAAVITANASFAGWVTLTLMDIQEVVGSKPSWEDVRRLIDDNEKNSTYNKEKTALHLELRHLSEKNEELRVALLEQTKTLQEVRDIVIKLQPK